MGKILRSRWSIAGLSTAFAIGLFTGAALEVKSSIAPTPTYGRPRLGSDRVRSVPPALFEGGDRNAAALERILERMKSDSARLERLERAVTRMEKAIASIGAQLDAANGRLARIAGEAEPGGR